MPILRKFEVLLDQDAGTLKETVSAKDVNTANNNEENIEVKKLKKRDIKLTYRQSMKDPTKFSQTHMADADHPTLIIRRGAQDEVNFFCFEEFVISVGRDPNIEDEPTGSDVPFTKRVGANDVTWTFDVSTDLGGGAPTAKRFKAGPYKVAADADQQRFYKFSILTKSGITLDPDIVTEP
jgi:hypothetical protein